MDVILKVLEGAKIGAKVAIKKDKFLIGRSSKCHLCAGSTSVSRKHCAITRDGTKVTIKDLGSRNGTLVNDEKILGEVELTSGDEVSVGPLRFRLTITPGLSNQKRPHVKSVTDAAERTVKNSDSGVADDDITQWLLESDSPSKGMTETQTISMDDTRTTEAMEALVKNASEQGSILKDAPAEEVELPETKDSKSKSKKKKELGKLPPLSKEPATKDSRDAASAALRNMNRQR